MSVTNSIYAIPATYINAATLDPILWQAVNPSGLPHACCLLRISNINKSPISISYDGVTENDVLDADSVLQIDLQDNKSPSNNMSLLKKGTVIYVKGNGGAGYVYVTGYYQV